MKVLKMLVSLSKRIFDKLSSPAHTVRRGAETIKKAGLPP